MNPCKSSLQWFSKLLLFPLCASLIWAGCSGEPTESPTPGTPDSPTFTPTATPAETPTPTPRPPTPTLEPVTETPDGPTATPRPPTPTPPVGSPTLQVLTPTEGQISNAGLAVGFSLLVTDNGPTSALTVAAFSSLDGELYNGAPATGGVVAFSKLLSPGTHLLTFSVVDADDLSAVKNQSLRINQAPTVDILAPKNAEVFAKGSTVKVQAKVTDPDDAFSTLDAIILSSQDGIVGEPIVDNSGYVRADLTDLSSGEHLLEVQITDPNGSQDTAQVSITLNACSGEDLDDDGYSSDPACTAKDCNDNDDTIYPGAPELCNGIDEDCDAKIDDGVTSTWYKDTDGDGYGATSSGTTQACTLPTGYSATSTDCNDAVSTINPGAAEVCNGKDDNCDGKSDDGQGITYYRDADGDGYGDASSTTTGCTQPSGYASRSGDCNDSSAAVNPGAAEVCNGIDDNCDSQIDPNLTSTFYRDADADGYGSPSSTLQACSQPTGYSSVNTDCDDVRADVNPAAAEVCNGRDDNCDGKSDDGVAITYYRDADGDGYGVSSNTLSACAPPSGYASKAGDCNDNNGSVNPGATEACNAFDDDCDGVSDEGVTITYYKDQDADAHGSSASGTTQACSLPSGYASTNDDCNDADATIHPDATESCDGKDNDCDADIDGPFDVDNDGVTTCATIPDCKDTDATVFPGASESCNSKDDDCDGTTDEGFDQDNDGYKTCGTNADCDDQNASIHPGVTEVCDNKDNDCDGAIDTGIGTTYYVDADKDGYGTSLNPISACSQPSGYATVSGDCDDTNSAIKPGATETCNTKDDDCDGSVDESLTTTYYPDVDQDGYGGTAGAVQACAAPLGYITTGGDCNDADANVKPGVTETCNSKDDNCDGIADNLPGSGTFYKDIDNDGYGNPAGGVISACTRPTGYAQYGTDCDDLRNTIFPSATETCGDGIDSNCDGRDGCTTTTTPSSAQAGAGTIRTSTTNEGLGRSIAMVGDVDGDGIDDLLVGAPREDGGGAEAGAAFLYLGPVFGPLTFANADAVFQGEQAGDNAGESVAGAGDVNNDGYADILIGADLNDTNGTSAGAAYLIYGPVTGTVRLSNADVRFYGVAANDRLGSAVDGGGDVNGDGYSDIVLGAYGSAYAGRSGAGCVYYFQGSASFSGTKNLSTAKATLCGSSAGEAAGRSLSLGSDLDGDGMGDILIGADGYNSASGAVYLISSSQAISGPRDLSSGSNYKARFTGENTNGRLGNVVDHGGDLTGDGLEDLVLGAPLLSYYSTQSGAAYMIPGGALTGSTSVSAVPGAMRLPGDNYYDSMGSSVAGIGDINGDGYDDLAVSAYGTDAYTSYVYYRGSSYIFFGPITGLSSPSQAAMVINGEADGSFLNAVARGQGDINGDGYLDLAIGGEFSPNGSIYNVGAAYLWPGPVMPWARRSIAYPLWAPTQATSYAGRTVSAAGDVDGDGLNDMLVGAPDYKEGTNADAGTVWLVSGSSTLSGGAEKNLSTAKARFLAQAPGDMLGTSAVGVGDVNGDGLDDILLGAPYNDEVGTDAGAAYLILGPASGAISVSTAKARFLGEKAGDQAGFSVASLGDMNKDGYADFAIGADKYDDGSKKDTGAVYVVFGSPTLSGTLSLSTANARLVGELNYDYAGCAVAGPGDVNGDGTVDLLIGAKENDGSAIDAGAVYLLYGPVTGQKNLSSANVKYRGPTTLDYAGSSLSALGDTNLDGKADFAVGAPGADPSSRSGAGRVYVVLGATAPTSPVGLNTATISFAGDTANDAFGKSISGGDVNGDGTPDLLVGAPGLDVPFHAEAGAAYLFIAGRTGFATGEKKALDAAWMRYVGMVGDGSASAVAILGDVNGDLFGDIAMGIPGYDTANSTQTGAVMLVPWRHGAE